MSDTYSNKGSKLDGQPITTFEGVRYVEWEKDEWDIREEEEMYGGLNRAPHFYHELLEIHPDVFQIRFECTADELESHIELLQSRGELGQYLVGFHERLRRNISEANPAH